MNNISGEYWMIFVIIIIQILYLITVIKHSLGYSHYDDQTKQEEYEKWCNEKGGLKAIVSFFIIVILLGVPFLILFG